MKTLKFIICSFLFFNLAAISPASAQQCGVGVDADVVVMIDLTGSISATALASERQAAHSLLDSFSLTTNPPRVAIGTFNKVCDVNDENCEYARILGSAGLTKNYGLLHSAIDSLTGEGFGNTDLGAAIDIAQEEIDSNAQTTTAHFIVVISDGIPTHPNDNCVNKSCNCASADLAAKVAKNQAELAGSTVIAVHFDGMDPNTCAGEPAGGIQFLRDEIASDHPSNGYFFEGAIDLSGVLDEIAGEISCDDNLECTVDSCDAGGMCSFIETDSDSDGTGDCSDECPNDELKTAAGACGCGISDEDLSGDGVPDCKQTNEICRDGEDCIFEELKPFACAGVNGFLNQTNIASVLNLLSVPLDVTVTYRDLAGAVKGSENRVIAANNKQDFIINTLGVVPDTYGTVCVQTSAGDDGSWTGGVTVYKPNVRGGALPAFGTDDDFALFHPFTNPRQGTLTQPVNTFHLGVNQDSTVANWLSITDAKPGDGKGLSGQIVYFDLLGNIVSTQAVSPGLIPDGGRFDFSAHEGLSGPGNANAYGMARFIPDDPKSEYYIVLIRYFYDCFQATCADFHTAFVIPFRPATNVAIAGNVSTVRDEIAVVELSNVLSTGTYVNLSVVDILGTDFGMNGFSLAPFANQHVVINKSENAGFLQNNLVGGATAVPAGSSFVSAISSFYSLDKAGVLEYGYSAPLLASPGLAQITDFNTFIGHRNETEIFNPSNKTVSINVRVVDVSGAELLQSDIKLKPGESDRLDLSTLPVNTVGVIIVNSDPEGVIVRNYIIKAGRYVLPLFGR